MTRYDFAPIEALVRVQLNPEPGRNGSDRAIAAVLGVDRKQVLRWREHGVTTDQAETLALRAGFIPYEVWDAWLELDPGKPCDHCGSTFWPPKQRFCRDLCRVRWHSAHPTEKRQAIQRAVAARRRERDDVKAHERAYAAQYREQYREQLRKQAKRYYAADRVRRLAWQREYDRAKRESMVA